jgi:hypothetical protein
MKKILNSYSLITALIFFGLLSTLVHAGSLDGKYFSGQAGVMGQKAQEKDDIKFENGVFTSVDCQKYGFSGAPYHTTTEGDKIHFVSDTYSKEYGRIIWQGTVEGPKANATFVWYNRGKYEKPEQVKWYSGTLK